MYKMQLLSCIPLTLVLVANSAPITSSSTKETEQQMEQLLLDLQLLLNGVNNYQNPQLSRMLTFKFYTPKKATEFTHLQCLAKELKNLEEVLGLPQSKNVHLSYFNESLFHKKGGRRAPTEKKKNSTWEQEDKKATITEFMREWITVRQRIYKN
uniref:Interleukin-2 n=1 Tax=Canis lupus familiaris TaxID=9615 RepID=Q1XDV3_CANLF|nr:interleukin-2 [Canis lupus familiaris]